MRLKASISILGIIVGLVAFWLSAGRADGVTGSRRQDEMAAFSSNECVWCHSRLSNPLKLTSRYAEWHVSIHKGRGVGCDRCHGGDPRAEDQRRAHRGVLPASHPESRLSPGNLSTTCRECHQPFVTAFIESRHYKALRESNRGPSCNTCHAHMASEVIYTPEQTAKMCASCHDSATGDRAAESVQAIRRGSMMAAWADRLIEEADRRGVAVPAEQKQLEQVRRLMSGAKTEFHTFATHEARRKADAAWEQGTQLKDGLRRKLYPKQ